MKTWWLRQSLIIFFVAALAGSSTFPQSKRVHSDSDINLIGKRTLGGVTNNFPIDHEMRFGEAWARDIARHFQIIDDPVVTDYFNRLAKYLTENSDARVPVKVQIMNSVNTNAIFPSEGHLIVSSSLVLQTDNEAELAGILAHGIAHAALPWETGKLRQLAMIPAMVILPVDEPLGEALICCPQTDFFLPGTIEKGRRDTEFDADYFGLQYVYKAGYDPNCFIDFLDRISRASTKKAPSIHRGLPIALQRVKVMRKEVAEILPSRDTDVVSSSEYDAVRARLLALKLSTPKFKKSDKDSPPRIRYSPKPDQTAHIN